MEEEGAISPPRRWSGRGASCTMASRPGSKGWGCSRLRAPTTSTGGAGAGVGVGAAGASSCPLPRTAAPRPSGTGGCRCRPSRHHTTGPTTTNSSTTAPLSPPLAVVEEGSPTPHPRGVAVGVGRPLIVHGRIRGSTPRTRARPRSPCPRRRSSHHRSKPSSTIFGARGGLAVVGGDGGGVGVWAGGVVVGG